MQQSTRKYHGTWKSIGVVILACGLSACNSSTEPEDTSSDSSAMTASNISQKIMCDHANLIQIAPHQVDCASAKHGKSKHQQVCVRICHRPPGNPDNSKILDLPLQALKAHIGHGDYMGDCDGSAGENPGEETGGSTDDGSVGTQDGTPDVIPNWCVPYLEIDANCDGIHDVWGVPYL